MTGVSWRTRLPCSPERAPRRHRHHRGFDGRDHIGTVIVDRDVAPKIASLSCAGCTPTASRFACMTPVDAYGGSDFRSIEADDASAFNCRFVEGTTRYSEHAYGRDDRRQPNREPLRDFRRHNVASGESPLPAAEHLRPGMAAEGGALVRGFDTMGWGCGRSGRPGAKDYQRLLRLGPLTGRPHGLHAVDHRLSERRAGARSRRRGVARSRRSTCFVGDRGAE